MFFSSDSIEAMLKF